METQTENQRPDSNNNGQLISVPHKDTIRLLEVFVTRSLSLNDGALGSKKERKDKWVTMPNRQRRHSSDPSIHLMELQGSSDEDIGPFSVIEPPASVPDTVPEEPEKPPKKSKNKKPSFWKSFVGFFSRKNSEEKDEDEDNRSEMPAVVKAEESLSDAVTNCLPATTATLQKKKSTRRKSIKRRFSKRRRSTIRLNKDLNTADISRVEAVISVEPTYAYYEKVSQELERIVHEVKEEDEQLTDEQIINRIIALTKEQGDAIDDKLKDNPTLSGFFQRMSYSSFQKLADAYLETEASPTHNPPTVPPTAPELIKLAFTYDFTAKIARLSRQNVGHITGLGNRYLEDRFEYKQACTDHPMSDSDS
ncbi:uncharacterized protein [Pagrus major]|uniref:uncharacterized protein n=1 Tax=Pagrus major TaxID=143350 RepID=UPI003CC8551A